ncbi:MAG: M23 family metallopeptidase [Brevinematales bacterium]
MGNQNIFRLLREIGIFLEIFLFTNLYGLYWNGSSPLPLPFVGQGVIRASLEIPLVTNIPLSFTYISNLFIIQPFSSLPEKTVKDGLLHISYPWKETSYSIRLVTIPPEISFLYIPELGRGKSGLVLYQIKSLAPFQTWLVDSMGLVYHPYSQNNIWITLVGWPLSATQYQIKIVVEDAARNRVEKPLPITFFKTSYRVRTVSLASDFSKTQGQEVNLTNLTGDPLKDYDALMREFARQTKVSIFNLTYKRPSIGTSFLTNIAFLPISNYSLSSLFGDERRFFLEGKTVRSSYHNGIDFVAPSNTPVFSPWGGKVLFADYNGGGGNTVVVDHGLGLHAIYMHLEKIKTKAGETISPGQMIGIIGKSGYSTGIHLHLGFSIQGRYVDPSDWTNTTWIENNIITPMKQFLHPQKNGEISSSHKE